MDTISLIKGTITNVVDLTPTAREFTIKPDEPFPFVAGAYVNLLLPHEGRTVRRAFSMSSNDKDRHSFSLTIRFHKDGELTSILWHQDPVGKRVELMGPLGQNTAEKLLSANIFLFGFGIGAGVIKSIAEHVAARNDLETLTIVTGSRSIEEILYKEFFDALASQNPNVSVKYVVSDTAQSEFPTGYIEDHIAEYDFSDADVYLCGRTAACKALSDTIKTSTPQNCRFFIEDFY